MRVPLATVDEAALQQRWAEVSKHIANWLYGLCGFCAEQGDGLLGDEG